MGRLTDQVTLHNSQIFHFFPVLFWEWKSFEERKVISPIFSWDMILGQKLIVELSKSTQIMAIEMWSGKFDFLWYVKMVLECRNSDLSSSCIYDYRT